MTDQEYRANRVFALARVAKMRRLGLIRCIDNQDGSITIEKEDFADPILPDPEDLLAGEASYRAAEDRGDLPW